MHKKSVSCPHLCGRYRHPHLFLPLTHLSVLSLLHVIPSPFYPVAAMHSQSSWPLLRVRPLAIPPTHLPLRVVSSLCRSGWPVVSTSVTLHPSSAALLRHNFMAPLCRSCSPLLILCLVTSEGWGGEERGEGDEVVRSKERVIVGNPTLWESVKGTRKMRSIMRKWRENQRGKGGKQGGNGCWRRK
jgi:hypothetical protein